MGRKLAFVKWPWTGDPEAPYVRAGVAAAAEAPEALAYPASDADEDEVAAYLEAKIAALDRGA
jgi:hypothetical protein